MKNVCKRLTAILLTFIMILALLPTPGSAQQLTQTEQPAQSSETAVQPTEGSITAEPITGTEVISLREENVKHFDMGNGTFQAIAYSHPVHELDENGQWQDIDFSLSPSQTRGVSTYENKAAGVSFPATYTQGQPILSLSGEGNSIEMTFLAPAAAVKRGTSATSAARVSNPTNTFRTIQEASEATFSSTLVYEDVLPDVDFEYIVEPDGVKENIVVNTRKSSYSYAFRLSLDNLIPQIEAGGAVAIYDGISGELRYAIPNPVMYDADFDMSEAVRYQLSGSNGNYLLTVTADAEWINAEGRSFPVKIDPSIIQATENIQDTYIDSDTPNEPRYLSPLLWVRSNRISYIKTPDFGLPNGATLQWANLHAYYYYLDNITQGSVTVGAYQVVNNWSAATQTWSNANNYPNLGLSTTLLSQGTAYVSAGATTASPELLIFDITSAAQSWLQTGNNYGIALKYLSGPNLSVLFKSYEANGGSFKPRFVYQYTPPTIYSKILDTVPTSLRSDLETHPCIPCAITNVVAYWSVNGYEQFGCTTAEQQEMAAIQVTQAMATAGSATSNYYINAGLMLFQHTEDELTYRLLSQQYSTSEFTYENVVAEIDANRPFLMGFAAGGPYEGAHMTVCVGYEYGAGTQYVFVSDAHNPVSNYEYVNGYRKVVFDPEAYNDFVITMRLD